MYADLGQNKINFRIENDKGENEPIVKYRKLSDFKMDGYARIVKMIFL